MRAKSNPDTAADVERARHGDVDAFERIYRAHVARIHGLSRRLVGVGEADDATQEIFVRAWQRLRTFRGEAAFATWLTRLARNVLLDRIRKRGADRHVSAESVDAGHELPRPISKLDCERALARLPDGARRVLVLHDVEGHTHQEIATMLGVGVGTSKSQLHRARALLRDMLAAGLPGDER